jgi:hypothetical protein
MHAGAGKRQKEKFMRRYQTDRYGMIASFDIAEALRRAERRQREREHRERGRAARAAERVGLVARMRAMFATPRQA